MQQHVKILGVLNIVYGAFIAFAGVIVLMVFGGLAGLAGLSGERDAAAGAGMFGLIGGMIGLFLFVMAAPSIIAGWGLMKYASWARIVTIIVSALHLMSVPFGTALGIYGLWVLLKPETEALLRPRPQAWPAPTA